MSVIGTVNSLIANLAAQANTAAVAAEKKKADEGGLGQFDANDDGSITRDEIVSTLSAQGVASEMALSMANDMIKKYDTAGTVSGLTLGKDGVISITANTERAAAKKADLKQYDTDGDGWLTKKELSRGLDSDALAGTMLALYDENKDDKIDLGGASPLLKENTKLEEKMGITHDQAIEKALAYYAATDVQRKVTKDTITPEDINGFLDWATKSVLEKKQSEDLKQYDGNGDGYVNAAEIAAKMVDSGTKEAEAKASAASLIAENDLNGDSSVYVGK